MSKIDPKLLSAFNLAFVNEQVSELKKEIDRRLSEESIMGPQGPKGDRGEVGPIGLSGKDGKDGETGKQGIKGDKGDQGLQGIQGDTGEKGAKGDQGIPGEKGDTGPRGERGEKGELGEQGIQGEVGPKGEQGIQGKVGPKGDRGERGLQGEVGPKGEQGIQGEVGPKGEQGDPGLRGPRGERGERGEQGAKGERGEQGERGEKGDKGDKGDTGEPPDITPIIKKAQDDFNNWRAQVNKSLSSVGGGGSTRILRMDDVQHVQYEDVHSDSILIYSTENGKFKTESIIDVLERTGYNPSGGVANISGGVGIDVTSDSSSSIVSLNITGSNDIVISADSSPVVSLSNTGVSSGTYGSPTTTPVITVDERGRVTEITQVVSSGGTTGGGTSLSRLSSVNLSGNTASIRYSDYNIVDIVSIITKDTNNKVVSVETKISDSDVTFNSLTDLSNIYIDLTFTVLTTTTVVTNSFVMSGEEYTLNFANNNIGSLVNYYVTDSNYKIVDVDATITDSDLSIRSNLPLNNLSLKVISLSI